VLAVAATLTTSLTASTTVPPSRAGDSSFARQIGQLTPAGCSSLTLTTLQVVSGTVSNSASGVLIIGSANVDNITDTGSNNCIVGGAGKDNIKGASTDVCIIGPTTGAKYTNCTTSAQ
jgi:hypothetical protein